MSLNQIVGDEAVVSEKAKEITIWRFVAVNVWYQAFIILYFIIFSSSFAFEVSDFLVNSRASIFNLSTWFGYFIIFMLHTLQNISKYASMTVQKKNYNTTLQYIVSEFLIPSRLFFILVHIISGVVTSVVFYDIFISQTSKCNSQECIQHLNESYLVLMLFGGLVNLVASIQFIKNRELFLKFPPIQQRRWFRLRSELGAIIHNSVYRAAVLSPLVLVTTSEGVYLLHLLSRIPLPQSHIKLELAFLLQTFLTGLFISITFDTATLLVQVVRSELAFFTSPPGRGEDMLLSALSYKKDPIIQHLAFLDLKNIASFSPSRRENFFKEPTGKNWTQLLNKCCDVIDNITTSILEIKNDEIKQAKAVPVPSRPSSPFDIVPESVKNAFNNVFKPKEAPRDPFEKVQLQEWAIEAISKLTALSLKEDPIGVVQNCNTIPTLLNSLLACLIAVEEYIQRPLPSKEFTAYTKLKLDGYQLVRARPYAIASGLSNSIFMIVTAFYENLSFFQFPPKHAYKLQLFVDFKQ